MQTSSSDSSHQTAPVQGETRTRMDPEVKARWVAALRSGEYSQGERVLHRGSAFCCLGVLCDLHAKETGGAWVQDARTQIYLECDNYLPDAVVAWAGLPNSRGGEIVFGGVRAGPAVHNDGACGIGKRTFAQIADAIEAQL
jgi:hypothetical protein